MRSPLAALTTVVAVTALVTGCGGAEPSAEPASSSAPTSAAAPYAGSSDSAADSSSQSSAAPAAPKLDDASVPLAERLTVALKTVADGPSGSAAVREAALFEQTSARDLAAGPKREVEQVRRGLSRAGRAQLDADIAAARELSAMTDPQPKLPDWRILTPPKPDALRPLYRKAQQKTGTPWEYLAAIHLVETRMGRIRGTSTAGAQGPMQFLPSTFAQYGAGGDINDPGDAIAAAGRMLANNGAPGDMRAALWSYNHSNRYVSAVSTYAEQIRRSPNAYDLYWHWQVLYRHQDGTMRLPEGYPGNKAVRISD